MEDTDGGLHRAVDGQSLGERRKISLKDTIRNVTTVTMMTETPKVLNIIIRQVWKLQEAEIWFMFTKLLSFFN